MKTLTLNDNLYSALEDEADRTGRPVNDLLTEAIEAWLADVALDEAERTEIEAARLEAAEKGGVEFESFFQEHLGESR